MTVRKLPGISAIVGALVFTPPLVAVNKAAILPEVAQV